MRTLASLVPVAAVAAILATPTAAAASDPGPIGGSTCYVVTVGPDNNPVVVTVCPPDGG